MRKLFLAATAGALSCVGTVACADPIDLSSSFTVVGNTGIFNAANLFNEQSGVVLRGEAATSATPGAALTLELDTAYQFGQIDLFTTIAGSFKLIGGDHISYDGFNNYINDAEELASGELSADAGDELTAQSFFITSSKAHKFVAIYFTGAGSSGSLNEIRLFDRNSIPPAVPEPATWAMMLIGFGACGVALRRSRPVRMLTVSA